MISKYEALQEQIDNQPALGQQKLKAMLRFLQDGQVSQSELEDTDLEEVEAPEVADTEVADEPEQPEEPVAEDDSEPVADAKPRKKGGVLKYIAVGVPTVLAIGGLVFWQVNENNKASSLAEQEVVKILEEAPKKEDTATALSSGEFDNNVKALTTAFDTIKQNDKTGLSGYFTFEDKRYIIQKYDQTGTLTTFDSKGEKVVYNDEWVQKFIENSKAKAKKTEKKEEKPKGSDDSSKKEENKKDADSNTVQTKKKEGSN